MEEGIGLTRRDISTPNSASTLSASAAATSTPSTPLYVLEQRDSSVAHGGSWGDIDSHYCVAVAADVQRLRPWLMGELTTHIIQLWPTESQTQARPLVETAVADAWLSLELLVMSLHQRARTAVFAIGTGLIKEQVPKIITAYRMTGKHIPTQPSPYLVQLVELLATTFHAHADSSGVPPLVSQLYQDLNNALCKAWTDLLATLNRTEQSMKKLAVGKAVVSVATGPSDADKSRLQVTLDGRAWLAALSAAASIVGLRVRTTLNERTSDEQNTSATADDALNIDATALTALLDTVVLSA